MGFVVYLRESFFVKKAEKRTEEAFALCLKPHTDTQKYYTLLHCYSNYKKHNHIHINHISPKCGTVPLQLMAEQSAGYIPGS